VLLLLLHMPTADDIDDSGDVADSYIWVRETATTPVWTNVEDSDG